MIMMGSRTLSAAALAMIGGSRALSTTPHIVTPLVRSAFLSGKLGSEVYLKLDCHQPSGSFKLRGIGATVAACAVARPALPPLLDTTPDAPAAFAAATVAPMPRSLKEPDGWWQSSFR